jgi:hypothetical protein
MRKNGLCFLSGKQGTQAWSAALIRLEKRMSENYRGQEKELLL